MATQQRTADPFKRIKTRHPGVTYREKQDGSRSYYVYAAGKQHGVQGGEKEALALQAELRGKIAKGIQVAYKPRVVREMLDEWMATQGGRDRTATQRNNEGAIRLYLTPALGGYRLSEVTTAHVADFVRRLAEKGLSRSYIDNRGCPVARRT